MTTTLSADEVRREFSELGLSIADWARSNQFSPALVYRVLKNPEACQRGQTHRIAVQLGLKAGRIGGLNDLSLGPAGIRSHEDHDR